MTRFAAPISEQIWDMKYRLKQANGTPVDRSVEDTWRRIARSLATVEDDADAFEAEFYAALEDFKFLPAGRIVAGAGTDRASRLALIVTTMSGHAESPSAMTIRPG